jgi:hypothetical protein
METIKKFIKGIDYVAIIFCLILFKIYFVICFWVFEGLGVEEKILWEICKVIWVSFYFFGFSFCYFLSKKYLKFE